MIVIVIDSLERHRFFRRIVSAAPKAKKDFLLITSEPISHLSNILNKIPSIYVRRHGFDNSSCDNTTERSRLCIEAINDTIPSNRLSLEYKIIQKKFQELCNIADIKKVILWNGQQLMCLAIADTCKKLAIPIIHLEISNLPRMIFKDPEGVNAESKLYRNPSLLDHYPLPNRDRHGIWLQEYEKYKKDPPPQSRIKITHRVLSSINYLVKFLTGGVGRLSMRSAAKKSRHSLDPDKLSEFTRETLATTRYIFLPLQVSTDTQLRINSEIDNLAAIEIAAKEAIAQRAHLLVKLHPAETSSEFISSVIELKKRLDFHLVEINTTDLIKHSLSVITINSTVGLEALLYEKNVRTLGKAIYASFDRNRLLKYIHYHLVQDVDYFSDRSIDSKAASTLLEI